MGIRPNRKPNRENGRRKIMWNHFSFTSGSNPYITTTEEARKKAIRNFRRHGFDVEKIQEGFYLVHDTKTEGIF